jgi:hypothetical protein
LEQIKFLLGHSSIQTTERYLGSDQVIAVAVNDNLGLGVIGNQMIVSFRQGCARVEIPATRGPTAQF